MKQIEEGAWKNPAEEGKRLNEPHRTFWVNWILFGQFKWQSDLTERQKTRDTCLISQIGPFWMMFSHIKSRSPAKCGDDDKKVWQTTDTSPFHNGSSPLKLPKEENFDGYKQTDLKFPGTQFVRIFYHFLPVLNRSHFTSLNPRGKCICVRVPSRMFHSK